MLYAVRPTNRKTRKHVLQASPYTVSLCTVSLCAAMPPCARCDAAHAAPCMMHSGYRVLCHWLIAFQLMTAALARTLHPSTGASSYRHGTTRRAPSGPCVRKPVSAALLRACTLQEAAAQFVSSFGAALDALLADPSAPAPGHPDCHPLNCYNLCRLRCVRGHGSPILAI